MRIDIHNHPDFNGVTAKKLLGVMDDNNVDITCLLTLEAPAGENGIDAVASFSPFAESYVPLERCVDFWRQAPERFRIGYCPDPRKPDSIGRLISAAKLYPVSLCGELKLRMMYDDNDAIRLYNVCGELGLPVLVHIDDERPAGNGCLWPTYWCGGGMKAFARAIRQCPGTTFIGHAPGFWNYLAADADGITELLDMYNNLCCDMSAGSGLNALSRDERFTHSFMEKYQDRIMFGTDGGGAAHIALLERLCLPETVLCKIYEENARRLLRNVV